MVLRILVPGTDLLVNSDVWFLVHLFRRRRYLKMGRGWTKRVTDLLPASSLQGLVWAMFSCGRDEDMPNITAAPSAKTLQQHDIDE